jgi:hypothetical protein
MIRDEKVLARLSAKEPRLYTKTGESYSAARARWRVRYAAYSDAYCMAFCNVYKNKTLRAFYGVELRYMEL